MKLILDTVVLVRALIQPGGKPGQGASQWRDVFEWTISPEIAAEHQLPTSRPRLQRRFTTLWSRATIADILPRATSATPASIPAIRRDPGDDKFLAAVFAGKADYLVWKELDWLSPGKYKGSVICNSPAMIDLFSAADVP